MSDHVRIANCSGFYGDRISAAREMVEDGPIDYLTGDYLAELTMLILAKDRMKDPNTGYAKTFMIQMEEIVGTCIDQKIRIVTNAGGLNPAGLAERVHELCHRLGLSPRIAYVEGDDLKDRLDDLQSRGYPLANMETGEPLSSLEKPIVCANAYLGAWPVVEALRQEADIVLCPRITDTALVVAPAAHEFGWARDDWDKLASAVVAGHILECGTQCTGGNYSFFEEVSGWEHVGFPYVDMHADGTFEVSKHEGTGGLVSVGTVTAQLLYEVTGDSYLTPDVIARFDTIQLEQTGPDRVRITGVKGEPAPPTFKLGIQHMDGFRYTATLHLSGLDIEKKARIVEDTFWRLLGGKDQFANARAELVSRATPDPSDNHEALATLRIAVQDPDSSKIGRPQFDRVVQMALSNVPGFALNPDVPRSGSPCGGFWPALLPGSEIHTTATMDGKTVTVDHQEPPPHFDVIPDPVDLPPVPGGPTRRVPLGSILGARSGDKGGSASLGFWARSPEAYAWAVEILTPESIRELISEARDLTVERSLLPNILAISFVLHGILEEGAGGSLRVDPQAKSLAEYARAKFVDIPEILLDD